MERFYPSSAPTMDDSYWSELAVENPLASNRITARDAADWFYLVAWLRYKTYPYGVSRDPCTHRRMIARWWSRIEGNDIMEARHCRAVHEGRAKPRRFRPRAGSREMPQEPRSGVSHPQMLADVIRIAR